ncbi:uncharacterized protein LOC143528408 [Brachyhypopomus gauderio]|uniref:uncharacterized protein LOC143528408 n=1 Tax=Brachyhypopomus gauderio TaxID=698409 RepID=UPI004042E04A
MFENFVIIPTNTDSMSVKNIIKFLGNLTEMKRKGNIHSFFSPKRKAPETETEKQSKVNEDEVEGEREEKDKVEGVREEKDKVEGVREEKDKVEGVREEKDKVKGEREEKDKVKGEREEKDKVEGEREEKEKVEGERKGQQKCDNDRIQGQGDQGQEEEHHSGEDMEKGEHHQYEEGERERQDNMQGSDCEGERRMPEKSPMVSSRAGPHDISKSRYEVPVQPVRESFPKIVQGGARRSFRSDWYKSHPWAHKDLFVVYYDRKETIEFGCTQH